MKTMKQLVVSLPCENCSAMIDWTLGDLLYAEERLDDGEHAACACDDDCAFEVGPWDRGKLQAAMRQTSHNHEVDKVKQ